jgi:hypothetical protein
MRFLLQMDDFDRLLEDKLRRMLDVVVAAPPPVRRGLRPQLVTAPAGRDHETDISGGSPDSSS